MRIEKSNIILDDSYKPVLVKEFAKNYTEVDMMDTPEKIVQVMNDVFHLDKQAEEYLYLIAMTAKCKPISIFEVSHGTHNSSLAGIREIFIRALLCGAVNFIILHNHPSGVAIASSEDIKLTKKMKEAAKLIDITFCDHIIIGKDSYFSFKQETFILNNKTNSNLI